MNHEIVILGARENNLKNLNLKIPKGKITVFTGVSGSGKSSLVFDTIFAEARRKYLMFLSTYARLFLQKLKKADVDVITGLSPAVAIEQGLPARNLRSTVGTMTEVYDYLRLLYSRIGVPHCPRCNSELCQVSYELLKCEKCGFARKNLSSSEFSFNRSDGACPTCHGLGLTMNLDINLVLLDKKKTIIEWVTNTFKEDSKSYFAQTLEAVGEHYGFTLSTPIEKLTEQQLNVVLFGTGGKDLTFQLRRRNGSAVHIMTRAFEGVIPGLLRRYGETKSEEVRASVEKFMDMKVCPSCNGKRLRAESLSVTIDGKSIADVSDMPLSRLLDFLSLNLTLNQKSQMISRQIVEPITEYLRLLLNVGLGYLTLNRRSDTLAGGEAHRVKLVTCLVSRLSGLIYVLDEPTIGLHPRNVSNLIQILKQLRDLDNTVMVVDNNELIIRSSDHVIDLGPGAGELGGNVIAIGTPKEIETSDSSLTGRYLSGKDRIPLPDKRRTPKGFVIINGASEHNLKNIDVKIPLGLLCCITGVSGSGKSTLAYDILYQSLIKRLHNARVKPGKHGELIGVEQINRVLSVDQFPIGKTPASNLATYTGIFDEIRYLFAGTKEAEALKYTPAFFSFNTNEGRCKKCYGKGYIRIRLHFLSDIYVPCDLCKGSRYKKEVLEVKYNGKSISYILDMNVIKALDFFNDKPKIWSVLQTLVDLGLGYLKLGQPATTLSGGEAQRIKLARELSQQNVSGTLFILDEPTVGLHPADTQKLIQILNKLVDLENSVVVVEHDLDLIKNADYIIDLGPEGGEEGGTIVVEGTPEEVMKSPTSHTAYFLREKLKN